MFKVNNFQNQRVLDNELPMSHYVPYRFHINSSTILTKNNELIKVIKLDGFSFESSNDIDLEMKKHLNNTLFKGLASGKLTLYFHTIRKKIKVSHKEELSSLDFLNYLNSQFERKNKEAIYFKNELYITIIYQLEKQGVAFFEYLYKRLMQKNSTNYWEKEMNELLDEMQDITLRIYSSLLDYKPKILELNYESKKCEILKFLSSIVNLGIKRDIVIPCLDDLSESICTNRLFFRKKYIELKNIIQNKYASLISIKEYPPSTSIIMLDDFLKADYEFIITQSFSFINKNVAVAKIQLQQNRMIQTEDKSISQIQDISAALDLATSGDIAFGIHHFSIMCISDEVKELENIVALAIATLSNKSIQGTRDTVNMEAAFWGQLPNNSAYVIRKSIIHTLNLAGLTSMHNYPLGAQYNNHWGPYVTILNTTSSTPFYFNFHVKDVGHTIIIGPTGSGKTALMNFLCAKLQKFNPNMYFFDKDKGAEIFIRSLGGTYTAIESSKEYTLNPLKMIDTQENRNFLFEWLSMLVSTDKDPLTAEESKLIYQAVIGNFKLNFKDRILQNIAPFLGVVKPGNIANRLEIWYGSGAKAKVFNNENDSLDLSKNKIFGFDMTNILQDKTTLPSTLSYLFHRIQTSLTGEPTVIILDEAWALIDNEIFAPKIKNWLKVLRKLNTFVIFATQSVEDATKSSISDTLIQQTATQIFLPNLKATDSYKEAFMLSNREFEIIRTTNPASRFFLIKQGVDSIVARIDLSGTGNVIDILSGRAETSVLLNKLIKEKGQDPKNWFYTLCLEINNFNNAKKNEA